MPARIQVQYSEVPTADLLLRDDLLAVIEFSAEAATATDDPRMLRTPLASCGQGRELWTTSAPLRSGRCGNIAWTSSADVLMGAYTQHGSGTDFAAQTAAAYDELQDWLADQPGFKFWRLWNIFPDINGGTGDRERYRQFCQGRAQSFAARDWQESHYPAATAIGSRDGPLFIMFLAGREAARQLENPRQLSAYHYPRQYGPSSPSFARAALDPRRLLMVSGTASVVGHESRHPGNWSAQLDETLANLRGLMTPLGAAANTLPPAQALRVYLRDPTIATAVTARLQAVLGPQQPLLVMQGDICRQDLLLEMEGVWQLPDSPSA